MSFSFKYLNDISVIIKDILPFTRAQGNYAVCRATNKIGLARKGFSREEVQNVHKAIRILLMGSGTVEEGLQRIQAECLPSPNIEYFIQFVRSSKRGIALSKRGHSKDEESSEV